MKNLFEASNSTQIIDFYGKHPPDDGFSIEKNGLLYRMLSNTIKKSEMVPCLGSYNTRNGGLSFFMLHIPTELSLNYSSMSTHRGTSREYEDIYRESLSAKSSCSLGMFWDKLDALSFLKEDFETILQENTSLIPSAERVKKNVKLRKFR